MARGGVGAAHQAAFGILAPGRQVQVQLQDARLAQGLLDLHRVEQFAQLARQRALVPGHHQLGDLLRDGAAAAPDGGVLLVGVERGEQLGQVVAGVLEEALVLGRQHGARQPAARIVHAVRAARRARVRPGFGAQAADGQALHARRDLQRARGQLQFGICADAAVDARHGQFGQAGRQQRQPVARGGVGPLQAHVPAGTLAARLPAGGDDGVITLRVVRAQQQRAAQVLHLMARQRELHRRHRQPVLPHGGRQGQGAGLAVQGQHRLGAFLAGGDPAHGEGADGAGHAQAVQQRPDAGRGGQPHQLRHAGPQRERAAPDLGGPVARRRHQRDAQRGPQRAQRQQQGDADDEQAAHEAAQQALEGFGTGHGGSPETA